jgi:hypothetical protein
MGDFSLSISRATSEDLTDSDLEDDDDATTLSPLSPASHSVHETSSVIETSPEILSTPQIHRRQNDTSPKLLQKRESPDGYLNYDAQLRLLEAQNRTQIDVFKVESHQAAHILTQESPNSPENKMALGSPHTVPTFGSFSNQRDFRHQLQHLQHLPGPNAALRHKQQWLINNARLRHQMGLRQQNMGYTDGVRDSKSHAPLQESDEAEAIKLAPPCGNYHSAPCKAAATSLLGSALSNEELSQISIEKDRRMHLDTALRTQQQILRNSAALQDAVFANQLPNGRHGNFFRAQPNATCRQPGNFHPHSPRNISSQTIAETGNASTLYHQLQGTGPSALSHPQHSRTSSGGIVHESMVKRGASLDISYDQQSNKKAKFIADSPKDSSKDGCYIPNSHHEYPSSLFAEGFGFSLPHDKLGHLNSSPAKESGSILSNSKESGSILSNSKEKTDNKAVPPKEPDLRVHVPAEENNITSPVDSSTVIDAEEDQVPLNDVDVNVNEENATKIQQMEFDPGFSVTTTTFKHGKTTTVMRVGDGGSGKRAMTMKQGLEIVTKTVVDGGVVTTTTTTALFPLPKISVAGYDELEDKDNADDGDRGAE